MRGHSVGSIDCEILLKKELPCLEKMGSEVYKEPWKILSDAILSSGGLLQIFVPNDVVDTIAYPAVAYGDVDNNLSDDQQRVSNLLKKYCNQPQSIGSSKLDIMQGRLLITNKVLLNPEADVKMYRYTFLTPEQQLLYEQKLDESVTKIIGEMNEHPRFPELLGHTPLGKKIRYNDLFTQQFKRWNSPEDKAFFGLHFNYAS